MKTYSKKEIQPGHLYRLKELKDFEIVDDDPDVRGWEVIAGDGCTVGKVKDLIADPAAGKVRYLLVKVGKDFDLKTDDPLILIPIGAATLLDRHDMVLVNNLRSDDIYKYPLYNSESHGMVRQYENSLRQYYRSAEPVRDGDDYYNHEHFDDRRFYASRRQKRKHN